jgi:hypothetical protein
LEHIHATLAATRDHHVNQAREQADDAADAALHGDGAKTDGPAVAAPVQADGTTTKRAVDAPDSFFEDVLQTGIGVLGGSLGGTLLTTVLGGLTSAAGMAVFASAIPILVGAVAAYLINKAPDIDFSGVTADEKERVGRSTAEQLAAAMRQVESGGNYNAVGDGGNSHGAYQFNKDTWRTGAQRFLGDGNAAMTKENQDKVAIAWVDDLLKKGHTPEEVALIWNTSLGGAEQPLRRKGPGYDSSAHAAKVMHQLASNVEAADKGQSKPKVVVPPPADPNAEPPSGFWHWWAQAVTGGMMPPVSKEQGSPSRPANVLMQNQRQNERAERQQGSNVQVHAPSQHNNVVQNNTNITGPLSARNPDGTGRRSDMFD